MRVLVCDDRKRGAGENVQRMIEKTAHHETVLLSAADLTKAITDFFRCRVEPVLRGNYSRQTQEDSASVLTSGFDIAILDNNLSELDFGGTRQTAESIAGYLRAFGNIPYVVSLNKNPHVDFDLRHLVGDHETRADLAVNETHLSNRALWNGDPDDATDGFLPWYWPVLNDAPARRRAQIQFVEEHFAEPILKSLGFPTSALSSLSRHAKGALSPETEHVTSLAKVTFKTFFVKACRSLPIRADRERLARAVPRENLARTVMSRVAAGELDRWIRRDLLGPQDVLVDLPHLLMRMPFLLGQRANDVKHWNEAASSTRRPYGLSLQLYDEHLHKARFVHDAWTKSPCFWWRTLKSKDDLNKMFWQDSSSWAEAVYCEDTSRFRQGNAEAGRPATEFAAEFDGSWNRRYIADLRGKHYVPKSRLVK